MCLQAANSPVLLGFWSPGPYEMLLVAVVALLLYGGQLPDVARSWGKTFAEFRRGLSGIQNEINDAIYAEPERLEYRPEQSAIAEESVEESPTTGDPDQRD